MRLSYCFVQCALGDDEGGRDTDHAQDHPPTTSSSSGGNTGGPLPFRDDKQEPVVVRPYLGQPPTLPQHVPIQPTPPVSVPGPPVHLPQGQPTTFADGQIKVNNMPLRTGRQAVA